ncbi:MAG: hypothetical protein ACE5MI_07000 [Acidimicrobiia bacterium]
MYWLRRPPYLRYAAAVAIFLGAAWLELRGPALVLHPFALDEVPAGTPLLEGSVEWREVPAGLLPPVPADGVTSRLVEPGSPLLPGDVGLAGPQAPEGWWGLELQIPSRAQAGQEVQIVVMEAFGGGITSVPGVVLEPSQGDSFGFGDVPGLVAVPAEHAVVVALASAEGQLTVLIEP